MCSATAARDLDMSCRLRYPEEGAPAWAQAGELATSAKTALASPRTSRMRRREERGKYNQWCFFNKSITRCDANCRNQDNVGSASTGHANDSADYINHLILFTAVEASTEEEEHWPFGPIDE